MTDAELTIIIRKVIADLPATERHDLSAHIASAVLAALPPAGWRDISTAPKDGRQIVVRYKNKDGEDRYTIVRWKEGEWRIGSFNGGKQIFVLAHQYQPNAWCELILPTAALPPAPQRTGE